MIKAVGLVLGVASSNKLAKISLSDSTIKIRINKLANDIEFETLSKRGQVNQQASADRPVLS